MKKYAFLTCIICASLYAYVNFADTQKAQKTMSEDLYNIPSNCDFSLVFTGTLSNECTPKLKSMFSSPFTGILINAPEKIVWPKNEDFGDYPVGPSGVTEGPLRMKSKGMEVLSAAKLSKEDKANLQSFWKSKFPDSPMIKTTPAVGDLVIFQGKKVPYGD
jgi:hypothetical protein